MPRGVGVRVPLSARKRLSKDSRFFAYKGTRTRCGGSAGLSAQVLQYGVSVEKRQPGQLRILALESPNGTYDENFLYNKEEY